MQHSILSCSHKSTIFFKLVRFVVFMQHFGAIHALALVYVSGLTVFTDYSVYNRV